MRRILLGAATVAALAIGGATTATTGATTVAAPSPAHHDAVVSVAPMAKLASHHHYANPPTTAQCEQALGLACYSPLQMRVAYNLAPLYAAGNDGTGQTIVIVDSFGSPTIRTDLRHFDEAFGIPAPPSLRIIHPAGAIPPFDPQNSDMTGWAFETTLDVEYAHAMAPGANILLVETPVSETEGVTGLPEMMQAENYVVRHHLGEVISQSFGATEETFPTAQSLLRLRYAYKNAAKNGVTVLGASGDAGATDYRLDLQNLYLRPVTSWPTSDPLVTSVGGTQLHLDAAGNRTQPDTVWNDGNLLGGAVAGGGGKSAIFARPWWQNSVSSVVGAHRGVPDISMSAAVDGAALVYLSGTTLGGTSADSGFYLTGGTSEATPIFAGIVAIADQMAGHGLGVINPALYKLARQHNNGLVDVTAGTNTVTFDQGGATHSVRGWDAVAGYDLASGLGTIDAAQFVPALVAAAGSR